jgi:general secretion pathway protein A
MLLEHFKLDVQPFGVTPDPRFLYLSRTHREALASLLYGIHSGRGFTALIAPPGMGKTTLLFQVLKVLRGNAKTAFLFQTLCGTEEFLHSLLGDLGIEHESDSVTRMHAKLNAHLVEESQKGHEVVVVIDEAQNLDDRVLELVRMLSNFETAGKKLMHLILSGQPQLAEKLASEQFIQLRQRISIVARLNPFSANETKEYIEHRLRVAGAPCDTPLFSSEAYAVIAEHSSGIPRNINNLCFNSMSLACALKRTQVDALMVRETINDLDLTTIAPSNGSASQARPYSTLFSAVPPPAASWRNSRGLLAIGLLIAMALVSQLWSARNDRVLASHSTNATQEKTANSEPLQASGTLPVSPSAVSPESTLVVEPSGKAGLTPSTLDAHPLPSRSHRSRVSSRRQSSHSAKAPEKAPEALTDSFVPVELAPEREKP